MILSLARSMTHISFCRGVESSLNCYSPDTHKSFDHFAKRRKRKVIIIIPCFVLKSPEICAKMYFLKNSLLRILKAITILERAKDILIRLMLSGASAMKIKIYIQINELTTSIALCVFCKTINDSINGFF